MVPLKKEEDRAYIVQALNLNMNEEFTAVLQYICHRIAAKGTDGVLAEAFKSASLDEMAHILFFSDLITAYGGVPEFGTWNIDRSTDITTMLEKDIALEQAACRRYQEQIERLQDYPALTEILSSVLRDEEDHESVFTEYLAKR